jgi:hypothetical protein
MTSMKISQILDPMTKNLLSPEDFFNLLCMGLRAATDKGIAFQVTSGRQSPANISHNRTSTSTSAAVTCSGEQLSWHITTNDIEVDAKVPVSYVNLTKL